MVKSNILHLRYQRRYWKPYRNTCINKEMIVSIVYECAINSMNIDRIKLLRFNMDRRQIRPKTKINQPLKNVKICYLTYFDI